MTLKGRKGYRVDGWMEFIFFFINLIAISLSPKFPSDILSISCKRQQVLWMNGLKVNLSPTQAWVQGIPSKEVTESDEEGIQSSTPPPSPHHSPALSTLLLLPQNLPSLNLTRRLWMGLSGPLHGLESPAGSHYRLLHCLSFMWKCVRLCVCVLFGKGKRERAQSCDDEG